MIEIALTLIWVAVLMVIGAIILLIGAVFIPPLRNFWPRIILMLIVGIVLFFVSAYWFGTELLSGMGG